MERLEVVSNPAMLAEAFSGDSEIDLNELDLLAESFNFINQLYFVQSWGGVFLPCRDVEKMDSNLESGPEQFNEEGVEIVVIGKTEFRGRFEGYSLADIDLDDIALKGIHLVFSKVTVLSTLETPGNNHALLVPPTHIQNMAA